MKKFIIEDEFWNVFPDAKIGIVVCNGIDNTIRDRDVYSDMIQKAQIEAKKHLRNEEFSSNPAIKVWREAFQKFKTKKGVRSSIEALLKRVQNGNIIGNISPLVDIYNSISLKYGMPCGGEDINTFAGDVKLTMAIGDEDFIPLGSNDSAPPFKGEIVYKDDDGAICRCWNWRESFRTMLTEDTTNAFMCIELVDESRTEEFSEALSELAKSISDKLGGTTRISVVDSKSKEMIIE